MPASPCCVSAPDRMKPEMPHAERRLAFVVLAAFVALDIAILGSFAAALPRLYPDFFGTWSFARFAAIHPAVEVYDQPHLFAFQRELAPDLPEFFPYPYPPSFLLLLAPLGRLPFWAAYAVWILPALAAYLLVAARLAAGMRAALVLLALPATALCIVYGQSGFLTAALLLGALSLLPVRPVAAGVLLGLLTVKPQLGLLVPVALLAARAWAAIAAAAVTALALVLLSVALHGWDPWPTWLTAMRLHADAAAMMQDKYIRIMATPAAALTWAGLGPVVARAAQAAISLAAAVAIWRIFRRGVTPLGIAALAVGTFAATPYAFVYDTPLAMAGLLVFVLERRQAGGRMRAGELALCVFAALAPAAVFSGTLTVPVLPLLLLALFVVIARHALQKDSDVA